MIKKLTIASFVAISLFLVGFYLVDFLRDNGIIVTSPERGPMTVSYIESDLLSGFVLNFAKREGIFEKYGLDIEMKSSENFVHEMLLTRQADVVVGPTTLMNFYFLPDVEMRWLGNVAGHYSGFLVSRYAENETGNIGKVGVARPESLDNFKMRMILRTIGIDPDRMEYTIDLGDSLKGEMLRLGEIDVALIERVDVAQRLGESGFHIWEMDRFREGINYSAPHILTLEETIVAKGPEVRIFVMALFEAVETIMADEDAALRVMMNEMMIDGELAEVLYRQYRVAFEDRDYVPSFERIEPVIPFVLDLDRAFRVNKDPEGILFTGFAEEAVEALGIER